MRSLSWLLNSAIVWKLPATIGKWVWGMAVFPDGGMKAVGLSIEVSLAQVCETSPTGHSFCISFAVTTSQLQAPALLRRHEWGEPSVMPMCLPPWKGGTQTHQCLSPPGPVLWQSASSTAIGDPPSKRPTMPFTTWPGSGSPSPCTPVPHMHEGSWH